MTKGKTYYDFTIPKNVRGGLFSRTFIQIDEETILCLRHQIISDEKLWDKK